MVKYEHPVEERREGRARDEVKTTHPAYAQIGASRVTGGINLYGSDFQHQGYIVLRISRSEMNRSLSNDWPFAREELIEVAMSYSQWAEMVSTMNVGSGVCCTIQHIERKSIPQIPSPERKHKLFREEASDAAQQAIERIDGLEAKIEALKISQKQKDDLLGDLGMIKSRTKSNLRFIAEQFGEYMEATVAKAKTEISAYAHNLLVRTGISKLVGGDAKAKQILGYQDRADQ